MPTSPAVCASRLAGPPKSKSQGAMIRSAPWSISSTAALPTVTGSDLPSTLISSTGRPSMPPASFSALTASFAPRDPGVSSGAWMPVRQSAPPNTIGSS